VGETRIFTLEYASCLELFAIKVRVRTLAAAEYFSGRQTDTPVAEFCK